MGFELEYYETDKGVVPFDDFMDELPSKLKAKVLRDLDLLEEYGNELREPYSKSLGNDIYELRSIHGKQIGRSLYFFNIGKKVIITHGFIKKQKKTPKREIDRAIAYREDWIRRNQDETQGNEE